jgi:hypothetical protein
MTAMLHHTLDSGRTLRLEAFHFSHTYAGLLEGAPDAEYNARLVARTAKRMVSVWGTRRTYVIPPVQRMVTEGGRIHPRLPEFVYHFWLTSKPLADALDGSELLLVFFAMPSEGIEVGNVLRAATEGLQWDKLASDFVG